MVAATTKGHTNGVSVNGTHSHDQHQLFPRFLDVPPQLDIPVRGGDGGEEVTIDLTEIIDETDELCDLLENENAAKSYWITIALAYVKQRKINIAIDILQRGLRAHARGKSEDRLSITTCLAWLQLWKCRRAPRVRPSQPLPPGQSRLEDGGIKEDYLRFATQSLNEAGKLSIEYPPLLLARGTTYLLRASLQPSKSGPGSQEYSERTTTLKQALKCFEDALRYSNGRNLFALLGKAKVQYSLGNAAAALSIYQQVLERAPDMLDPDPRIGIGACLWTLGHKDQAHTAWERSVELNPSSVIAHTLCGLYWLDRANNSSTSNPEFPEFIRKAYTIHYQSAFKLDNMHALTCAGFAGYFLRRRNWVNVERLSRRAIEHTDVNAVASDGWYHLALWSHNDETLPAAMEHYTKADQARGGDERGYLPAKFGAAQLRILLKDVDGAKFRLDKIVERTKNLEAMTLLGVLCAEDVFNNPGKEDKSAEARKAISLLEQVRTAWRDPKKTVKKDNSVLLNLARLYEADEPGKALACLREAEAMLAEAIPDEDLPDEMGDEHEEAQMRREFLPPQLLNNIACFLFAGEKYSEAREYFQSGLNACTKQRKEDDEADETDALIATMSYNLARTHEAEKLDEDAEKIYTGLLSRHPDYLEARMRLAYLALKRDPAEGAQAIKALLASDPSDLEVRALYGWFIHGNKKRTLALNEDAEQRHYKQTLQQHDKHDLYALTGMGNLHLQVAREMPRDTEEQKGKRGRMYIRAVEFFDKVLQLDPKNAFAAQGLGIALVEEKKDSATAVQIFSRVRESVKAISAGVHVNLGHVFAEVKQYSRAIENYELALVKGQQGRDQAGILACLGRVWLVRGRVEKRLEHYKNALDFARQALSLREGDVNLRFNVAFVQMQLAQMVIALSESQRTLEDVELASSGLDEAIESFAKIAKEPNPPFPRGDLDARANMGRNTMKRQLASALERQAEYERTNKDRLESAKRKREDEIRKREDERRAREEREAEERRKVREERERIAAEDRAEIERRVEEAKEREEEERRRKEEMFTTDEETGERKRRVKEKRSKRKKKGGAEEDDGLSDVGGGRSGRATGTSGTPMTGSDGEAPRRRKKRRLESRKGRASVKDSKFKSEDVVVESDEEDGGAGTGRDEVMEDTPAPVTPGGGITGDDEEEEEDVGAAQAARRGRARVVDDEDDEDDGTAAGESAGGGDAVV